jgi:prepilin-type N-terminal cleavage/methylation domain-containing protein
MVQSLKNQRSGFSLLEICIAMLVFSMALMLLMQFSINAYMGAKDARSRYVASLSAEKKLRELRIAPYTADGSDKDTVDRIICSRSWAFKDTNNVKRITVTVSYHSLKGADRQLTLTGVTK